MEGHEETRPDEDLAQQVREQSHKVAEQAAETGRAMVEERKVGVALQTRHLADALHGAAGRLREQGDDALGGYADWAAGGLDRFSRTLADSDVNQLIHRANNFARERPAVFLGGAVAAGLMLSRLLKSSRPETEQHPDEGGPMMAEEDIAGVHQTAPGTPMPPETPQG